VLSIVGISLLTLAILFARPMVDVVGGAGSPLGDEPAHLSMAFG
jgi:hypothetical protein